MIKNPTKPGLVLYSNQCSLSKRATKYTNYINGPLCAPIPTTLGKEQARKAQRLAYKALCRQYVPAAHYTKAVTFI